jgi:hypothetical protein
MSRRPALRRPVFALAAALCAHAAHAGATWTPFTPDDASFRVEMPGEPSIETRERGFALGRFVSTVYKTHRGHDAFGVNHTDIPGAILFLLPDKAILDATRKGFLESSDAAETAFRPSEVDGHPAWQLLYTIPAHAQRPQQSGNARILFAGKRLFIFYTEISPQTAEDGDARYFESIRIPAPH